MRIIVVITPSLLVYHSNEFQFDRVCGHKGYSYDAYQDNERFKKKTGRIKSGGRGKVQWKQMEEIGFENCDYVSLEFNWVFWNKTFETALMHGGVEVELHVPCRSRIDHLMSQCNFMGKTLKCDAASDEDFYRSVDDCRVAMGRFSNALLEQFRVKCYDFEKQFTVY